MITEGIDADPQPQPVAVRGGSTSSVLGKERRSPTRIMHIITGLNTGGAEMMLLKLLSASNGNWNSMVVSLGEKGSIGPKIARLGVPVDCLHLRPQAPNPLRIMSLIKLMRRFRPQLIQGWMPHGNLLASIVQVSLRHQVPVLWNVQMSLYDVRLEPWGTRAFIRLGALLSKQPAAIVYNSQLSARQHEDFGYHAGKRSVIATGFDCGLFRPDEEAREAVRSELGLESRAILIGLVARYHPMKDHACFFRAASYVVQDHPEVRFVLVGKGLTSKEPSLQELILRAGVENYILLLGERQDTPRLNAALDVACSASAWGEGFSNSIGEAMACGVPCVVTDVGDSGYLVGSTGVAVPPRNPQALAQAICQLIDSGEARRKELGIAARWRIETEFSLPEIVRRYEELYKSCLTPIH